MQFETLSSDQLYDILRSARYEDIAYLCRINRNLAQLCRSQRGLEVIKRLKHNYQLNLSNSIIDKIEHPAHFFYILGNFSSDNQNLYNDYYQILSNVIFDLLERDPQLLDALINDFNLLGFNYSSTNRLQDFLDYHQQYYGELQINDIFYILRAHPNLIPLLNNITREAIRKFLLQHPEILLPLLNYLN